MADERIAGVYVDVYAKIAKLLAELPVARKAVDDFTKQVDQDNTKAAASTRLLDDRMESLRRTIERLKTNNVIQVSFADQVTQQLDRLQQRISEMDDENIVIHASLVGAVDDQLRDIDRIAKQVDAEQLDVQTDDQKLQQLRAELEEIKQDVEDLNNQKVDIDVDLKTAGALTNAEIMKRQLDLLSVKSISLLRAINQIQGTRLNIQVPTSVDRDLANLEQELHDVVDELGKADQDVDINVVLTEHVEEKLNKLVHDIDELREPVAVGVSEHGAEAVSRDLEEVSAEADRLDGKDVHIDVHVDTSRLEEFKNLSHEIITKTFADLNNFNLDEFRRRFVLLGQDIEGALHHMQPDQVERFLVVLRNLRNLTEHFELGIDTDTIDQLHSHLDDLNSEFNKFSVNLPRSEEELEQMERDMKDLSGPAAELHKRLIDIDSELSQIGELNGNPDIVDNFREMAFWTREDIANLKLTNEQMERLAQRLDIVKARLRDADQTEQGFLRDLHGGTADVDDSLEQIDVKINRLETSFAHLDAAIARLKNPELNTTTAQERLRALQSQLDELDDRVHVKMDIDNTTAEERVRRVFFDLANLRDLAGKLRIDLDVQTAVSRAHDFLVELQSIPKEQKVEVDADTSEATRKLEELRAEVDEATHDREIKIETDRDSMSSMVFLLGLLNQSQAAIDRLNHLEVDPRISDEFQRAVDSIEVRLSRLNNEDVNVAINVVGDANEELLRLIAEVESLDRSDATIDISVNEQRVRDSLNRLRNEVDRLALDRASINVGVAPETLASEQRLDRLTDQLDDIDAKDVAPDINVKTTEAEAKLHALEASLDHLDGKEVNVKVDVDRRSGFFGFLRSIGGGGSGGGGGDDDGGGGGAGFGGLFGGGRNAVTGRNPLGTLGRGLGLDLGRSGVRPQTAGIAALVGLATTLLPMLPALNVGVAALIAGAGTAVGVIGTLAVGLSGLGDAIGGDVDAYNQLDPVQKRFVRQIQGMLPILKEVRAAVADTLLPRLSQAIGGFFTPQNIAAVSHALQVFARAIGDSAVAAANFFKQTGLVQEFSAIFEHFAGFLPTLTVAFLNFLKAVADFTQAVQPLIDYTVQLVAALLNLFSAWLKNAAATGQVAGWVKSAETAMGLLIQTVVALWRVLGALLNVLTPIGLALLRVLLPALAGLADWLNAHVKQIDAFAIGVGRLAGAIISFLWPGIKLLATALAGLLEWFNKNRVAAGILIGVILAMVAPFAAIAVAAVAAFSLIAQHWDALSKSPAGQRIIAAFHAVVHAIEVAGPAIVNALSNAFDWILNTGVPALVRGFHSIQPALNAVWKDLQRIFSDIIDIVRQVVIIVVALWDRFGSTIVRIVERDFKAMVRIIKDAFDIVADIFDIIAGVLTGDWGKVWTAIKDIPKKALDIVLTDLKTWAENFFDFWKTLLKQLYIIVLDGLEKAIGLFAKIPTSFSVRGHRVGIKNPFQSLKDDLDGYIKDLTATTEKGVSTVDEVSAKVAHSQGLAAEAAGKAADDAKKKNKDRAKDKDPLGLDSIFDQIKKQQDQAKNLFGTGTGTDLPDPGKFKPKPTSADAAANQIVPLRERKTFLVQLREDLQRISQLPAEFRGPMRKNLQELFAEISNPKLTEKEFAKLRPQLTKQLDEFIRLFSAEQIRRRVTGKDEGIITKALNLGVIDQAQANKVRKQITDVVEAYNVALRDHFLSPSELRRIKSRAATVADSIKQIQDAMKNATQENKDYIQSIDQVVSKFAGFASNITGLTSQQFTLGSPYMRAPSSGGVPFPNASATNLSSTVGYKTSTQSGGPVIGEQNVIINHPTDPYVAAQKARHATEAEFSRLRAVGG